MTDNISKTDLLFACLFYHTVLQQQLIEAQQKIIELHNRIDKMTPKHASDDEIIWHVASNGMMSDEAANSDDLATVKRFRDWNVSFAKKHIKPYVNPTVYGECLNQMTRGLATRIAELESKEDVKRRLHVTKPVLKIGKRLQAKVNTSDTPSLDEERQLALSI